MIAVFHGPSTLVPMLDGVVAGDEKAWADFVTRYREPVARWMRIQRIQPADVEDLFQELLIKLHKKLKQYDRTKSRFRTWLRTVLLRMLQDFREKRLRLPCTVGHGNQEILESLTTKESLDRLVSELDPVEVIRNSELWRLAVASISPNDLVCYMAYECHGRTVAEIAEELGRTQHAVHQATNRARSQIRELRLQFVKESDGGEPQVSE